MRFLVKFGWYVEANNAEDARLIAKENLVPACSRMSVDSYEVRKEPEFESEESEDDAEYCEICQDSTVIKSKCHECGEEYDDR